MGAGMTSGGRALTGSSAREMRVGPAEYKGLEKWAPDELV